MNKLLKASLLTVGLSISAFAADKVPVDTTGGPTLPAYAGSHVCRIDVTTGTNAVLCTSGPGVILQVYGTNIASTDVVVFRDSATANTTSSSLTVVAQNISSGIFVYPRFVNGLSANYIGSGLTGTTGTWTIIYKKL